MSAGDGVHCSFHKPVLWFLHGLYGLHATSGLFMHRDMVNSMLVLVDKGGIKAK